MQNIFDSHPKTLTGRRSTPVFHSLHHNLLWLFVPEKVGSNPTELSFTSCDTKYKGRKGKTGLPSAESSAELAISS